MKTFFSVKVTGSITVSIESNEDGDANGGDDGVLVDDGNVIFDALLAPYMKSLMNDAVKKNSVTRTLPLKKKKILMMMPSVLCHNVVSLLMLMMRRRKRMMMLMMLMMMEKRKRIRKQKRRPVICVLCRSTMSMRKTINSPRRWT
jgi:hypothetical protein